MSEGVMCIKIDLKLLSIPIRNRIMGIVQKSRRMYLLENQELSVDIIVMREIMKIL